MDGYMDNKKGKLGISTLTSIGYQWYLTMNGGKFKDQKCFIMFLLLWAKRDETHDIRITIKSALLWPYLIIHFKAGKHWVFKANINSYYMVDQCICFMGFQRRRDGQSCSCISVENVNQLLFLYCSCTMERS